jgi:hypothetical protein
LHISVIFIFKILIDMFICVVSRFVFLLFEYSFTLSIHLLWMFGDRVLLFDLSDFDVGDEIILWVIFVYLWLKSLPKFEVVFAGADWTLNWIHANICIHLFSANLFDCILFFDKSDVFVFKLLTRIDKDKWSSCWRLAACRRLIVRTLGTRWALKQWCQTLGYMFYCAYLQY